MEHPTEPALPAPLPRPLSDPLRRYRWVLLVILSLFWVTVVAVIVGLLLPDVGKVREAAARTQAQNNLKQFAGAARQFHPDDAAGLPLFANDPADRVDPGLHADDAAGTQVLYNLKQAWARREWALRDTAAVAAFVAFFTVLLCTFFLLPRRATNAIYLRSFRNDATTGALRTVAQAALGPAFRLSGIRDPRRRWPALIRHLLYMLFLIRYAQPKFMNLEAGRDWKARLWRSLGEARCALIDVSELTPFVREEIELATHCLGFQRVLFIGDDSRTADEWRQAILAALGSPDVPPERLRVALWADTAAGRAAFEDQVRAFADRLPAEPPGLNPAAFPETASSSDHSGNAVTGESWWTFLLANLIGVALSGALLWAENRLPDAGLVWYLPTAIYYTLAFLLLLQYFAVCGSLRQRLRIGGTFLFAAVVSSLPVVLYLVAPIKSAREAANRTRSQNNWHHLRLAVQSCADGNGSMKPTIAGHVPGSGGVRGGGPAQQGTLFSLLPYMEQMNASNQYPGWSWNSNAIVKTYIAPGDPTLPSNFLTWGNRGATSYSACWYVFQGEGGGGALAHLPATSSTGSQSQHIWGKAGQGAGPGPNTYSPGTSNTVVPPLGPSAAAFDPFQFQGWIMVGRGDGSVSSVSSGISSTTWYYPLAPANGEVLGPDW